MNTVATTACILLHYSIHLYTHLLEGFKNWNQGTRQFWNISWLLFIPKSLSSSENFQIVCITLSESNTGWVNHDVAHQICMTFDVMSTFLLFSQSTESNITDDAPLTWLLDVTSLLKYRWATWFVPIRCAGFWPRQPPTGGARHSRCI
jgi:hypothetical protein